MLANSILRQHGREVLKIVRKGEKALGNLARWQNHKHFNIRCRIDNVIPNSLKLQIFLDTENGKKLTSAFSKI